MFLNNKSVLYQCFFIARNPSDEGGKITSVFSSSPFRVGAKTAKSRYSGTVISLLILIIIIFSSCQPKALKNLAKVEQEVKLEAQAMIDISIGEEKTFRAKVKGFNQEMSGLLVAKRMDTSYRFVMVTDFGLKVFDYSQKQDGSYEFHHIMKHMDYDFLKNSIALDMLMLLPFDSNSEIYEKDDFIVYTPQKKMLYFVTDEQINKAQRFRGKRKIWAEAKFIEDIIEIHQNKPEILIQLKPL